MFALLHRPFRVPSHFDVPVSSLANGWSPVTRQSDASLYLGSRQVPGYIKVWLRKPSSADATSALSTSTLWCGSVWTSPPACVHPLPHVAQWESKSHGEEKKHLLNSVSMLSQWWSMTGSYICYCNTAWVTTKQRNNVIVVKTFAGVSPGAIWPQWRQRGRAASSCLLALLEGTAAPWESNLSVGLDMWATTWFMVM